KARGVTIDLGFAHLELPSTIDDQPSAFHLGIIDVPGHEDFVKNMVAGVGSIDLALFVVAADDGWMPQTEEHLQILSYLGVSRAVVALTKIDLVEREEMSAARLREKLANSPFAEAPIVPTSVLNARRLGELKLPEVEADMVPGGDVSRPGELGATSATLDVLLEKSGGLAGTKTGAARPLKDGARVRAHLGSANAPARVHLLDRSPLQPGERALAQIRCETPLFAFAGDRFIVRDWPEQA